MGRRTRWVLIGCGALLVGLVAWQPIVGDDAAVAITVGSRPSPDAGTPATPATPVVVAIPDAAREAIDAVVDQAAADAGVAPAAVTVEQVMAAQFPDTALGCPQPGGFYAQVITPGYVVIVSVGGIAREYHASADGAIVVACR